MTDTQEIVSAVTSSVASTVETRILALEDKQVHIQELLIKNNSDTKEIVEWIRSAKIGASIAHKFAAFLGKVVLLVVKFFGFIFTGWALWEAWRTGRPPSINLD